ncbi:MAG TPA: glycosyltransferase, partial [Candidatus Ozemobacteraceae bacterium]|nr:glycosyltransferase [Candidatus Ozemobacteraceae bacterium]
HKAVLVANASSSTAIRSPRPSGPPWQIVSAGAHYEWIDIPWLERLAAHPQVRLHIAGPGRGTGFRNLLSLSGVTYHGVLSQSQLNALFQRCHTGVIPFVDSELTRAVDPIKAYEYAAAGLRVWASPVPGLDTHPCVTDIISDQVSFMQAIDRLPLPISQRSVPTWADRAREVLERLTVTRPGESR